ncbi:nuclear transport factor 2 family protein [Actinoallomurus sp. NBC_01490]|uniref:nuclear transport factor 2 family protein n=1 Tax=Actinoallomurus sp. NBC_01490 TaxID=2903557 RepID=UPI002E2F5BC4|nr:nuclear transport factor 2 family protein [Actinoallomurus sp. NBC_01490]
MNMDIGQFVDRYVAVWNEPDEATRRDLVAGLWAEDGVEITGSARYQGRDAIETRVARAHEELVRSGGFVFRSANDAAGHHGTVAFTTYMVPATGGDIAWAGRVFAALDENGLIRSDHQFTVEPPALPPPAADESAGTRATAEELLRRMGEGDPDRIAAVFAEHVDWRLNWPDGDHPAVPWIRPRATRADVADHFREIAAAHIPEKAGASVARVLVEGTDAVVLGDIHQTVKATGEPYTARCALHLTVQDGQITRYAVYEDSLTVAEALLGRPLRR